ncbi:MAG TPA: hypothetical protein VFP15_05530 [Gemmatimonadaceae bacterium]|nr:hypothetical protein [Gemmatimonadaceae bacterium]
MRKKIARTAILVSAAVFMGTLSFGAREAWATGHPVGSAAHAKALLICNPDDCSLDCAQIGKQGRCIVGQCFCDG